MDDTPETQNPSRDEAPTLAKSRRWLWVTMGLALVGLLAAVAFLAGRYIQMSPLLANGGGSRLLNSGGLGGQHVEQIISNKDILPAEGLPTTSPDARGVFIRRQDNSVFVGTGQVQIQVNGNGNVGSSYSGPLVEVVTNPNTQVYGDVTFQDLQTAPASGEKIQQKVVPGSLDEIGQDSEIQAWGKKVGDRLAADVLVYTLPDVRNAPLK
jgi:hypothetical protein